MSSVSLTTEPKSQVAASASAIIESIASRKSSTIYAYDLALQNNFGLLSKSWAQSKSNDAAPLIELQTRAGAGLGLAGRMSEGTSLEGSRSSFTLTAFTTPEGLAQMVPSLSTLAPPTPTHRLVIQVPAVSVLPGDLALTPSLASLSGLLSSTPPNFSVIATSSPQESADIAALAYTASSDTHIIHIFDHFSSAREVRKLTYPSVSDTSASLFEKHGKFEYVGAATATDVFVAINGTLSSAATSLSAGSSNVGVLSVRLVRPFDERAFVDALPSSVKRLHVVEDVARAHVSGPLFQDVLGAFIGSSRPSPTVRALPIVPAALQSYLENPSLFSDYLQGELDTSITPASAIPGTKQLIFFNTPDSPIQGLPSDVVRPFLASKSLSARLLSVADALSRPGGLSVSRAILSQSLTPSGQVETPIDILLPIGAEAIGRPRPIELADFTAIIDASLLKTHSLLRFAKPGSPVLIVTQWSQDELVSNLPDETKAVILSQDLRVFTLNTKTLGSEAKLQKGLAYVAFLRLYLGEGVGQDAITKVARGFVGAEVHGYSIEQIVSVVWRGLIAVAIPPPAPPAASGKTKTKAAPPLSHFSYNTVDLEGADDLDIGSAPVSALWHDAAKHILFREAFTPSTPSNPGVQTSEPVSDISSLRPTVPTKTFLVTCSVNKRLTPKTYNRNVFHMEFDTKGTGLTYQIGEALGIHGWNDDAEVLEFCKWYGADPNSLISVPVPGSGDEELRETRTVFQALQQQIDLFGRPPKSFYADLAEHAKSRSQRMALLFTASPEGASTFKNLSENDTVSYADVLKMYPSARPSIQELCEMIDEIKERHYSIASAQSVVGDRVDLLVVTVDWTTSTGAIKYGQCTRYLAALKPGQKVTVSIKPSVMKLPPNDLQPIIMAGLGTGAAPFRAFIQHRALLRSQGKPVGPLVYYFGSRHRSQEYLYGEEIEAYINDSVITHAGLAFSRDSDSKVYIQHKMQQDGKMLAAFMNGSEEGGVSAKGVFYLCGPTWPVPDVYEALVSSFVKYAGYQAKEAGEYLEGLKEAERYVLEVY